MSDALEVPPYRPAALRIDEATEAVIRSLNLRQGAGSVYLTALSKHEDHAAAKRTVEATFLTCSDRGCYSIDFETLDSILADLRPEMVDADDVVSWAITHATASLADIAVTTLPEQVTLSAIEQVSKSRAKHYAQVIGISDGKKKWSKQELYVDKIQRTCDDKQVLAGIASRVARKRRPKISQTSENEIKLRHEIGQLFHTEHDARQRTFRGHDGNRWRSYAVDILLPDEKIAIEYDSWWWHKSEKSQVTDLRKNEVIEAHGYTMIRLRQKPLDLLGPNDTHVSKSIHYAAVAAIEQVVRVLQAQGKTIPVETAAKIAKYKRGKRLCAEEKAQTDIRQQREGSEAREVK